MPKPTRPRPSRVRDAGSGTKTRFQIVLERRQLEALRLIEEHTGAKVSEQIRRAIDAYLASQKFVPKVVLGKLLG